MLNQEAISQRGAVLPNDILTKRRPRLDRLPRQSEDGIKLAMDLMLERTLIGLAWRSRKRTETTRPTGGAASRSMASGVLSMSCLWVNREVPLGQSK